MFTVLSSSRKFKLVMEEKFNSVRYYSSFSGKMCFNVTFIRTIITCCKNGSFIPGSNMWSAQWPQACSAGKISEPIQFEDLGEANDIGGYLIFLPIALFFIVFCFWKVLYTSTVRRRELSGLY